MVQDIFVRFTLFWNFYYTEMNLNWKWTDFKAGLYNFLYSKKLMKMIRWEQKCSFLLP